MANKPITIIILKPAIYEGRSLALARMTVVLAVLGVCRRCVVGLLCWAFVCAGRSSLCSVRLCWAFVAM